MKPEVKQVHYSMLAGPLQKKPNSKSYQVEFNDMFDYDRRIYRLWTRCVAYGALLVVLGFGLVLFQPSHWIVTQQPKSATYIENWIMLISLALLQIFLIIGTLAATRSTLKAKDPIPTQAPKGLRVAFATTRAPGEPIALVRKTLEAAKLVRYKKGSVDVWLLDETDDAELKVICFILGVRYFSRAGIEKWNTTKAKRSILKRLSGLSTLAFARSTDDNETAAISHDPYFAARTKHGNFNSWSRYLVEQGIEYYILAGVDTDQVPERNYLERLLGYFNDPNVAYAVGPQVYGNYRSELKGLVTRWAESQASFFQSTIQRAGNASSSPMFVGTNYAVRTSALAQIGGFQPCITEDMATGLAIHASRNPQTGKRWKSVYTPDVLAIGEGPELWGPYFTQQWRWAAGTFDTWRRMVWRVIYKLSPSAMLHYVLMLVYYPMNALTWLFGIISSLTYLFTGATAILAPWAQFVSLYMMTVVMQLSLYFWNRRYNVSPHEARGTYGIFGMVISTLTSPIYFSALVGMALGKKAHFVVTSKGDSGKHDRIQAFRTHLQWAILISAGLLYGFTHGHHHPAMVIWAAAQLIICLLPFLLHICLVVPVYLRKLFFTQQLITSGGSTNV